jgi:ADP-ribosylglycohydrolase
MIGAIIGDIVGSRFEGMRHFPKHKNFSLFPSKTRFTDDTVMSVATADAILFDRPYRDVYKEYYTRYPKAGYGKSFKLWAKSPVKTPYNSWGNGSAMRVSPIGWAFNTATTVLEEAEKSASVTHNHPEGVKGAQSVAYAIWMLRIGADKEELEEEIVERFGYDLHPPIQEKWDVSCQGCVPQAFKAFLDSEDFEDCIRRAVWSGGDSDTIAAIAGSIAEPFYGIPDYMLDGAFCKLTEDVGNITEFFVQKYVNEDFVKPSVEDMKWRRLFHMLVK